MENKIRVAREGASHELDFEKGLVLGIGPTPERLQIIPVGLDEKDLAQITTGFLQVLESLQK